MNDLWKSKHLRVGIVTTVIGIVLLVCFPGKFWGIWAFIFFAGIFVALLSEQLQPAELKDKKIAEFAAKCQHALGLIVIAVGVLFAIGIAGVEIKHTCVELTGGNGDEATKYLVRMLDALLLGLVMFLFGKGIYDGILLNISTNGKHSHAAVTEFKGFLYGAILLNIVVRFFGVVLTDPYNMNWTALVIPISVFLLAAALWLLMRAHGNTTEPESKASKSAASPGEQHSKPPEPSAVSGGHVPRKSEPVPGAGAQQSQQTESSGSGEQNPKQTEPIRGARAGPMKPPDHGLGSEEQKPNPAQYGPSTGGQDPKSPGDLPKPGTK